MFTGIVEAQGTVTGIRAEGTNIHFDIQCEDISAALKVDQSIAHDGVCLTVTHLLAGGYSVTAVAETLEKTNLKSWKEGRRVNLERAMLLGDRLDGHIVQGHVDTRGTCIAREELQGSHLFTFEFPAPYAALIIEKGSVCINGVSLTAFNVSQTSFMVTIIPYTWAHTNFQNLIAGDPVNLEFDILGKYILRMQQLQKPE